MTTTMPAPPPAPASPPKSAANPAVSNSPANTLRFDVRLGVDDLGSFTSFEGLTFTYDVKTYEEGGENGFVHSLAGRLKYENLKVTRPVDAQSARFAAWFATLGRGGVLRPTTATVTAFNDNKMPVASWTFTGVYPVRYSGPSFSLESGKVALETFEFAHQGLLI